MTKYSGKTIFSNELLEEYKNDDFHDDSPKWLNS